MKIIKTINFCYGHRLADVDGPCSSPHGHNGILEVELRGENSTDGMVMDFSEVKSVIGGWIERNWDHAFIYAKDDETMRRFYEMHPEFKRFVLPNRPTTENMVEYLVLEAFPKLMRNRDVKVTRARLWETPNNCAEAIL